MCIEGLSTHVKSTHRYFLGCNTGFLLYLADFAYLLESPPSSP